MIRDWLACLAIARSLGRAGRHETGELRRSASSWQRRMLVAHFRSQVSGFAVRVDDPLGYEGDVLARVRAMAQDAVASVNEDAVEDEAAILHNRLGLTHRMPEIWSQRHGDRRQHAMIRDWLACLAIARALGRTERHDVAELWRLAPTSQRRVLIQYFRHQVSGFAGRIADLRLVVDRFRKLEEG
jgi:hypothetical protein